MCDVDRCPTPAPAEGLASFASGFPVVLWSRLRSGPPVAVWTPAQTGQFLHAIRHHRLYAAYHLTALRGEAAGLRWSALDLDAVHQMP
jgi:hypothetical protein